MGGYVRCVGAADVNEAVPARISEQLARCLRRSSQLLPVLIAFGDEPSTTAEVLQLEVEDGKFGRRNSVAVFAERKRRLKNIARNKGFRFLPGLVRIAAKRQQPIKDNLALFLIGDLDLCPLNKGAHFVHAAKQNKPCAGGARRLLKLGRVHHRCTRVGSARYRNDTVLTLHCEIALQGANEIRGAPLVSRRLISRLAGCIDIIEIEDRQCGRRRRNVGSRALAAASSSSRRGDTTRPRSTQR